MPGLWSRSLARRRSEEHTSELQSLTNVGCRLLLEKKRGGQDLPHCPDATKEEAPSAAGVVDGAGAMPDIQDFFFLIIRPPPRSTLFPYPPLFRSPALAAGEPVRVGGEVEILLDGQVHVQPS